jgi:hypothetical protein
MFGSGLNDFAQSNVFLDLLRRHLRATLAAPHLLVQASEPLNAFYMVWLETLSETHSHPGPSFQEELPMGVSHAERLCLEVDGYRYKHGIGRDTRQIYTAVAA